MRGNEIIVSSNPKGMFLEGVVSGTPKPGTAMSIKAATKLQGGEPTWTPGAGGANGSPALIAILTADVLQGKDALSAYVNGTRCFLYAPIAGEDMNILAGEGAGTSNSYAIGDKLMMDNTTGVFIASSGSPPSIPFVAMEALTQVVGSSLLWAKCTGH
jgi:hypothetical protein